MWAAFFVYFLNGKMIHIMSQLRYGTKLITLRDGLQFEALIKFYELILEFIGHTNKARENASKLIDYLWFL